MDFVVTRGEKAMKCICIHEVSEKETLINGHCHYYIWK
jgi:hypothetical protein